MMVAERRVAGRRPPEPVLDAIGNGFDSVRLGLGFGAMGDITFGCEILRPSRLNARRNGKNRR